MVNLNKNKIFPLVICGGTGTRLWPLSRKSLPKQFLECNPKNKISFIQETFLRLKNINNVQEPILICNEEHRFIVAEQMREINVEPKSIILEPFGRNTAPAIALGIINAMQFDQDPLVLVLPADHLIKNPDKFNAIINKGIKYALNNQIVTFGIPPKYPETGFGYIEAEEPLDKLDIKGVKIKKFIEKPDKKTAEKLLQNEKYTWNSGIFLTKAKFVLQQYNLFEPELLSICKKCIKESSVDLDFLRISKENFEKCPDIPFDIAIMEKTEFGMVLPLDVEWSDVGSWDALFKISEKDLNGNTLTGNVLSEKIKNCYLRSENKLLVGVDIEDLIVVETSDAVLVTKKGSSQKVKNLVDLMKIKNFPEATTHRKIYRPWGSYISLSSSKGWQVKRINVNPGASLSLQKHNYRTEHWVVVNGKALVEIEKEKSILSENESTYIPLGFKHRLSNPGKSPLILIEVQSGEYLGEDDIVRFDDKYGRDNLSE
ncbi:mannose-1-phosphate guanylyltransferase/mannose-6-phosphate isomerase [Prochlorococcus marinus]|uniref:mannose-1-phosphate guanylyltransferase/mannose-6-phosphate isomerase n=1 Tax=Prochlorococcus marinus TaxID=1219 RepID=UPI001ADD401F|nr:mannose-1-phosphate guanylyltransferase/mannose-6-phosphate isomerase [Prochlorococcus marinus]MBO8219537.1 mannose-1-phosphate guanylyltransferase/mannose-6-phosphate isomerase [Prochlorococcus marinus CUG1416]MBW3051908.1 mannose-1-phosphate guanylyltransferase/mannose-6-phosphate isomerase [Prochlorococcus marinus str. MU1416]